MSSGARFACQLALPAIGPEGQARLRAARCAVALGDGAAGHAAAWALAYVAAAGVGRLELVGDVAAVVSIDEATGHPLLHVADAGQARGAAFAARLRAQAPDVSVALDAPVGTPPLAIAAGSPLAAGAAAAATYLLATAAGRAA